MKKTIEMEENYKRLKRRSERILNADYTSEIYATEEVIDGFIEVMNNERIANGLTKSELSELLGIHPSHFSKITAEHSAYDMRGRQISRPLTLATFINFCRIFGYDITELVGREKATVDNSTSDTLSAILFSLNDETIRDIMKVIKWSDEPAEIKLLANRYFLSIIDSEKNKKSSKRFFVPEL